MAIDKDIYYKTAVRIDYTRTGNTLNRRERHGIKDMDGVIHTTYDNTTQYVGEDALEYLESLKHEKAVMEGTVINITEQFSPDINFISDQIDEIEDLL